MENDDLYMDLAAQHALARAVIQKYAVVCSICAWRNMCDYEQNAECNFVWDGKSI